MNTTTPKCRLINNSTSYSRRHSTPLHHSGAAVSQRLELSPRTKEYRVLYPAGSHPDFHMRESCRAMPLSSGFSRGFPVPPPPPLAFWRCTALHYTHLTSPSLAVETSMLRATSSECEMRRRWRSGGMQGRGKVESPEKIHLRNVRHVTHTQYSRRSNRQESNLLVLGERRLSRPVHHPNMRKGLIGHLKYLAASIKSQTEFRGSTRLPYKLFKILCYTRSGERPTAALNCSWVESKGILGTAILLVAVGDVYVMNSAIYLCGKCVLLVGRRDNIGWEHPETTDCNVKARSAVVKSHNPTSFSSLSQMPHCRVIRGN
ncbi:hypothetical protein PR048_007302 [Dryococelus australis]|uniref:Uncharacterized protein n=1 Tax=Dryococelus australis TaxID=614101 RepID=A0ABQ9IFE2_9NEOP|nr:hypothetical protein PR048_007302 [Dryococelus australis]